MNIECHQDRAKVEFRVRCTVAEEGDIVCLLGSVETLGKWDHTKAVEMKCVERNEEESTWVVCVCLTIQTPVVYKYVIKHHGIVRKWETITGNRTITPGVANIALGKQCSQSSTYIAPNPPVPGPRPPNTANNGNTNGYYEWMCSHTTKEYQPWWEIDLEMEIPICGIVLWNRQDRVTERLFPVWILIANEPFDPTHKLEEAKAHAVASKRFDKVSRTSEWAMAKGDEAFGRYVRVQLEGTNYLHFAELEVFHRVNFKTRNAQRLYSFDESAEPDFTPDSDERDHYSVCTDENCRDVSLTHEIDDGLLGLDTRDKSDHSDLHLMVDGGWLSAESGSELRIILGSFEGRESIYLPQPRPVAVEMRIERDINVHWPVSADTQLLVAETYAEQIRNEGEEDEAQVERHRPMSSMEKKNRISRAESLDLVSIQRALLDDVLTPSVLRKISALEDLSDDRLAAILARMERRCYKAGDTLIKMGSSREYLFIVQSGCVNIVGQSTIVGERVLSSITKGNFFGEMALIRGGIRTATVRAAEDTVCYCLHRDHFIEILGKKEHNRLREAMLRKIKKLPSSSYIARWEEDTKAVVEVQDEERAALEKNDIQVFRARFKPLELNRSRVMLDVFAADGSNELIGTVYILPSQFHRSNGCLTSPIISVSSERQNPILGHCLLRYLWINPLVHPENNLSVVWRNHWRSRPTLDVGHRGLGRSYHQVEGYRKAMIEENTLVSFIVAGQLGADYIEFDVQLTKDGVPVIYHDFFVEVGLEDLSEESQGEHYHIGIHDLTIRHLDRCRIQPVKKKSFMFKRLIDKHWRKLVKNSKRPPSSPKHPYLSHLVDAFPRLRHVLECVPERIGLNVELKYPAETKNRHLRDLPAFEMNSYIDAILKTVFDYAKNRRIIFSCFDPDVCVMLRAKQARYPVFFLTCAGTNTEYADKRCLSIESALLFAKMEHIQGIVSNSEPLLENPELITAIKQEGLILFTWGDKNSNHESVQIQKMHGVDAVISDNVGDLTKLDGKKITGVTRGPK